MKYIQSCIVIALSSAIGLNGMDSGKEARVLNLFGAEDFSWNDSEYYKAIKGENKDLALKCCAFGEDLLAIALTEGDKECITILKNTGLSYAYIGLISLSDNTSIQKLAWQNGALFALVSEGAVLTWKNPVDEAISSGKTIQKIPTVLSPQGRYLWIKKTRKAEVYSEMALFSAFMGVPLVLMRAFMGDSAHAEGVVGGMACAIGCILGYKAYKHIPDAAQSWSDFIKNQERVSPQA